jgi:hypothetical protein
MLSSRATAYRSTRIIAGSVPLALPVPERRRARRSWLRRQRPSPPQLRPPLPPPSLGHAIFRLQTQAPGPFQVPVPLPQQAPSPLEPVPPQQGQAPLPERVPSQQQMQALLRRAQQGQAAAAADRRCSPERSS